jgi:dsDNA-binding SOS-regulon protein
MSKNSYARQTKKLEDLTIWMVDNGGRWPQQIPPSRRVKNTKKVEEENSLGIWLTSIRKKYRDRNLDQFFIDTLNNINFPWDHNELRKSKIFDKVKIFLEKHGGFTRASENAIMYQLLRNHIENYENRSLDSSLLILLDNYNFQDWIKEYRKSWDDWLEECIKYKNKNGKWPTETTNAKLSSWISNNKSKYKKRELSEERCKKLEDASIDFEDRDISNEIIWDIQLDQAKDWYKVHKKWPNQQSKDKLEKKLGLWLARQKSWYNGVLKGYKKYPAKRHKKLLKVGFDFESANRESIWQTQYNNLLQFRKLNPNKWPNYSDQSPDGSKLGTWCRNQKYFFTKGKLEKSREELLSSINFPFSDPRFLKS